jgi:hypothetical protein
MMAKKMGALILTEANMLLEIELVKLTKEYLSLALSSRSIFGVAHATTTSAWASGTTQRRRRLVPITQHPYSLFDANAICVMVGLKYIPIRKTLGILLCPVQGRKTRSGIQRKMGATLSTTPRKGALDLLTPLRPSKSRQMLKIISKMFRYPDLNLYRWFQNITIQTHTLYLGRSGNGFGKRRRWRKGKRRLMIGSKIGMDFPRH